jgi:apolipoprotein D and lipocalin family protein
MKKEHWIIALAAGAGVAAITYKLLSKNIPKGASAVQPFDKERYMGLWYEIARMPSWIEKNLNQVTEDYSLNADGTMNVITRAYNTKKQDWVSASGKIKMAGAEDVGMLKVSYLGPVYLAYNVLAIDDDYQYALVSGSGLDYMWVLSRQITIPNNIRTHFLKTAASIGFDVSKLEWPKV